MEVKDKIIGRITKIHESGWGFLISEEIKFTKFFFHWTGLAQDTLKFPELKTGMRVKFIPIRLEEVVIEGEKKKGPGAIKIEVIS